MRLRFVRGIVAENVRIGGAQAAGPVLTLAEVQLQLDFHALLHRQVQVDGLVLRQGRLVWPVSPTNHLQLDNIQTDLRFQTNDTWSLDHFQADFAGAKLTLSGEIGHAPELRNWEMFRGAGSTRLSSWQAQLQTFSDTLDQIHFTGHAAVGSGGERRRARRAFVFGPAPGRRARRAIAVVRCAGPPVDGEPDRAGRCAGQF